MITTSITKSLQVCLDQVLQFDVYKSALQQTLSLEPTNAEFLKTREGINMWLNSLETFGTFKHWCKRIANEMWRLIDDSPITYLHWFTHVANNENVISHLQSILTDIQRASEEEDMEYEELISAINGLTLN